MLGKHDSGNSGPQFPAAPQRPVGAHSEGALLTGAQCDKTLETCHKPQTEADHDRELLGSCVGIKSYFLPSLPSLHQLSVGWGFGDHSIALLARHSPFLTSLTAACGCSLSDAGLAVVSEHCNHLQVGSRLNLIVL